MDKVIEEANELKEAISSQNKTEIFTEASDLAFTIVQCLRHLNLNLGDCLEYSNKKFQIRFETMSKIADKKKLQLNSLNLSELESLWNESKVLSIKDVEAMLKEC